jgi:dTMP kinase
MSRGLFIVLEGIDGSGKTTLVRRLEQKLIQYGSKVITVEEPGGTPVGERIRQILLARALPMEALAELFLFEAARHQLVRTVIRPSLEAGQLVLADRFALSSLAYQSYGRGLDMKLVRQLNGLATEGLEPDLTILLDLPAERALERKGQPRDRLETTGLEFLRRVRQGYLALLEQLKPEHGLRLDATWSAEALTEAILEKIREKGDQHGILLRPK